MKLTLLITLMLLVLATAAWGNVFDRETGETIPGMALQEPEPTEIAPDTQLPDRDVNSWSGAGPWGGNVRGLTTDPHNNLHVLAACGSTLTNQEGGVYVSSDGGINWQPTTLPRKQYNAMAGSFTQPNVFWAASRTGLYKSSDNGASWALIGSGTTYALGVGVSPLDGNAIVLGKSGGVGFQMSFDGGNNFSNTTVTTGFMRQFTWSAANPGRMFVVMGSSTSSIMTSIDNGLSWTAYGPTGNGWGMYVSPTDEQFVILAHDSGIYRTTDGGVNWSQVYPGTFRSVAEYGGIIYATSNAGGVYQSNDLGLTWVNYNIGIVQSTWQTAATSAAGALFGHWGGIFRCTGYQQPILTSHAGLNLALVHGLAYYADSGELWGGAEGSGLYRSTDNGVTWDHMVNGLDSWMIYELQPPNHEYYQSGRMLAGTLSGAYTSLDGGNSWTLAHWAGNQISGCEVHPTDPNIYWLGNSFGEVRYTFDGGVTFNTATGSHWGTFPRLKMGRGPTGNLRLFLCYQNSATAIWYSDDLGMSFVQATGLSSTTYQPQMFVRPGLGAQSEIVYVSTNQGIYKSTDYGATFSPSGMTGFSWSVVGSPGSQVVSGNGPGINYSTDDAATFSSIMQNLETYATVWAAAWGSSTNQLFIAMRTRGIMENRFSSDVYAWPTDLAATPGHQQVTLNWTQVSGTPAPIEYWIWRDAYPVAAVPSSESSYTDVLLVNGQSYKYFVSAVYADGIHTSAHHIISATPQAPTGQPPLAPQNLTVAVAGNLLYLDWDTVTEDIFGTPISVDEYKVFVGEYPYFPCTDEYLYTVTSDHTLIVDDLVADLDRLFFKVTAVVADN